MKFMSKDMKDVLAIVKRLIKDKKKAKMIVQSTGDLRILIKGISDNGNTLTYHSIPSLNDETYCFAVNPYDIENHTKGKNEEVEFKVNQKSITLVGAKANYKVQPLQEDIGFYMDDLKEAKNPSWLLDIFKGTDTALKKTKEVESSYLKLTAEKALAAESKQIHLFRLGEELPIKEGYLHKDGIGVLAKSIKGDFQFGMHEDFFVIHNKETYYLLKVEKEVQFPSFRNMTPLKRDIAFSINADEVNARLKDYKKEVAEILFTQQGNRLIMDPRNGEFPIHDLEINVIEGGIKRAIFSLDTIKSFFLGYSGVVQLEQQQFKNVYGKVGYLWRMYTPDKLTMITGIEEPDWEKIETYFREGRIKELMQPKTEDAEVVKD